MRLDEFIEDLVRIRVEHGGHVPVVFFKGEQPAPRCECCHYEKAYSAGPQLEEVGSASCEIPEPGAGMNTRKAVLR